MSGEDPKILKVDLEEDFDLGRFDLIICSEVLEHVFHYERLIDNAYKHLAHGGIIFVSVPFAHEVHGWAYNDYFRFTDQALRRLFARQGAVEIRASNSYVGSLLQKLNNLIFYCPVPYVLKLPFFTIVNLIMVGGERIVSGALLALGKGPKSLFFRLVYSFPLGYICVVRSDPVVADEALKPRGPGRGDKNEEPRPGAFHDQRSI
jgi:SAM-dependent methyltransferase